METWVLGALKDQQDTESLHQELDGAVWRLLWKPIQGWLRELSSSVTKTKEMFYPAVQHWPEPTQADHHRDPVSRVDWDTGSEMEQQSSTPSIWTTSHCMRRVSKIFPYWRAVNTKLDEWLQQIQGIKPEISVQESAILGTAQIVSRTLRLPGPELEGNIRTPTGRASGEFTYVYKYFLGQSFLFKPIICYL